MNAGDQHNVNLPDRLRQQLGTFRRRLWWMETLAAVLGGACGFLATYVLLFLSDRLWETPALLRLVFTLSGTLLAAGFGWYWANRWLWRRRDARELALMIQRHFPRLGDRLLGIVEIADETKRPPNVSPALCRAAMEQVSAEASPLDFQKAVPTRRARTFAIAFAALLLLAVAALLTVPSAALNTLARWLTPWSDTPRYTFAQLERLDPQKIVPYGEPFDVTARLKPDSEWQPASASARYERQPPVTSEGNGDGFLFHLPGQTRKGTLTVSAGDAREKMRVMPTFRPDLLQLTAQLELPAYLQYPPTQLDARNGSLDVVEGSKVAFAGKTSRALKLAALTWHDRLELKITGDQFASDALPLNGTDRATFEWQDDLGLAASAPFVLKINPKKDGPSTAECRGLSRVVAILEDEVLDFDVRSDDDFGVHEVGVTWEGTAPASLTGPWAKSTSVAEAVASIPASGHIGMKDGSAQLRSLTNTVRFSPLALNLGPQKVTLRAYSTDYYPDREPTLSSPYTVYILDRAEHAKLIQQRFETLQGRLEEILRAEENLTDANRNIREQSSEELKSDKTKGQLKEQERGENANAEALRRLQEEVLKLLKEALRNSLIPESVLQEWAKMADALKPVGEKDMPQVGQSLRNAQSNPSQRAEDLDEAIELQKEILAKLSEALKKMNEANEQLLAANFINRLLKNAAAETDVSTKLTKLLPQTVGLATDNLPSNVKADVAEVHRTQTQTQKKVRDIRDDLGHFAKRVTLQKYAAVHEEMQKTGIVDELGNVAGLITENKAALASEQAARWAKQLRDWAAMLVGDPSGGQGGGQCKPSADALELAMKLMRIRQQEEGIRDHTRFLEDHKSTSTTYKESALQLGRIQEALHGEFRKIDEMIEGPPALLAILDKVDQAMRDATGLLNKPQTDGETIAAETEVIELLSGACQQCAGQSGANASALAMLMQMMGGGAGANAGGSMAGGTTDKPNLPSTGPADGVATPSRKVDKAGGRDASTFPAEFRDALEAYFGAVEEGK